MADVTKAEKLASARKKLKQFQQKNKESYLNHTRSTSSSLKSNSPIDTTFSAKEQPDGIASEKTDITSNTNNIIIQPIKEYRDNYQQQEISSLFTYQTSRNNKYDSFFDDVSQKLDERKQFVTHIEEKNEASKITEECDNAKYINGDNQSKPGEFLLAENKDEMVFSKQVDELENLLSLERSSNLELQTKLMDSHNHILSLQYEIKRLNEIQNQRVADEVTELEDKIKVNLQTIEILVSEKSELQKELSILQDTNNANNSKCEELASRLKASRCQVQKLEKEVLDSSENKIQHNIIFKKLENDLQQKDYLINEFSQKLIDSQNEIKELNKRAEIESYNYITLKKDLEETEKQLSMAQIKLTQLGSETETDVFKELEKLRIDLETSRKDAETAWEEGRKCETELKQYISNLNVQLLQANAKCERTERDKDEIKSRVDNLVQHISDLEKQLQHEKNLRNSMEETEAIKKFKELLQVQEQSLISKDKELRKITEELGEVKERLSEAEIWKENVPDMGLLQQAMESDRVAAARAIEQNNTLKQKLQELEEYIIKINNSKLELTEELDKYRHMAGEYRLHLEKYKSRQEMRMVDSVTQTSFVKKSDSVSQTSYQDLAAHSDPHEPVSVETVVMIEGKLKKTMDKIAELSDDKQRLEHLVLQLQSETETIGEYVTLYQNQRSLLKEKAEERERQIALIAKEREELKAKLNEINTLLTNFPHNPEVENTTCKISSLLGEIQCSSIVQEKPGPPPTFHPCLLCSGKLINV